MTRENIPAPVSYGAPVADLPADLTPTPGQTIGPFYGYALPYEKGNELVHPGHPQAVHLSGTIYDGAGDTVPDFMVEIWQADAQGKILEAEGSLVRDGYTFTGWGRAAVDNLGTYHFTTVNPGPVASGHAPFISMVIFGRGLLNRLFTRIYLPEDEEALRQDPLLSSLPEERRKTLIARRGEDGSLQFDIHLQGENETVFLAFPGIDA
ncbi:protocatechuate 3,4-dioxygenase subunit alpha [Rothia nasimurium]|uniref:protocatechuate 3,4-dioxygenase subunit alpha n=1 Tax=Rothia nasimurium TaxID=85336 RepID=UPI003BA10974